MIGHSATFFFSTQGFPGPCDGHSTLPLLKGSEWTSGSSFLVGGCHEREHRAGSQGPPPSRYSNFLPHLERPFPKFFPKGFPLSPNRYVPLFPLSTRLPSVDPGRP